MTAGSDWDADAFFEEPDAQTLDGGTTSAGDLWHAVSSRWGHSMHTMCSYYGMFPAKVAHYFIERFSDPGDVVVDPFSGRGTTVLQAVADGRRGELERVHQVDGQHDRHHLLRRVGEQAGHPEEDHVARDRGAPGRIAARAQQLGDGLLRVHGCAASGGRVASHARSAEPSIGAT